MNSDIRSYKSIQIIYPHKFGKVTTQVLHKCEFVESLIKSRIFERRLYLMGKTEIVTKD